ncbi:MAG: iron(III) transport system substrate-binding protein [Alphaproteobacteria bacterium]|jgi:iron(III) transport system substrate-binding protein|nr:iron(III) transport system substrate-binding protein [Alphaproteobacteria bacterium]
MAFVTQRLQKFVVAVCASLAASAAPAAEVSPDLIAKARQEGQVTYYTDLIIDQIVRPLVGAFEARYAVKVNFVRGDSQVNSVKLLNEYRAGRVMADVFGLTSGLDVLIDTGAVRQFTSANGDELPPQYRDPDRYWVSSHLFVMAPGVNTSLVPAAQRPKNYDDLLAPYWKDKLAWKPNDMSGGPGFIGNVLTSMGEERGMAYLRRLAGQRIKMVNGSARAILDQVIAGEYPMALQIFNHHAAISKEKGAPVDWLRLSPATVTPGLVALTKNAPHPNAGLLFVEFMASKEGQQIFQKANYLPARPDVPPLTPDLIPENGGFAATVVTPATTAKSMAHWDKVFEQLFR